jgi:hypothetical protein
MKAYITGQMQHPQKFKRYMLEDLSIQISLKTRQVWCGSICHTSDYNDVNTKVNRSLNHPMVIRLHIEAKIYSRICQQFMQVDA